MVGRMDRTSAGKMVKERREAMHLEQAQVAAALLLSPGAVSQWETGRTVPKRRPAEALDKLLQADGEVLRAYGYLPSDVSSLGTLADLTERVATLESQMLEMAARVEQVVRLAPEVQRRSAGTGPS